MKNKSSNHNSVPIYTLEVGSSIQETVDLLGQPKIIKEDQEEVRREVQGLLDSIRGTNQTLETDANSDTIQRLQDALDQSDAQFIAYVYDVVEETPNGTNRYVRSLYFVDDYLIFN